MIKSILQDIFRGISYLTEKLVAIGLIGATCLLFWTLQIISRDMLFSGMFKKMLLLALLWFVIWASLSILVLRPSLKLAKALLTIAGAMVLLQTLVYYAPSTTRAVRTVATYQDQKNLREAERAITEIIQSFDCDRSNANELKFFGRNGLTKVKVPLVYWARDPDTKRIICFHEPGVYPKTGQLVNAITEPIRQEIRDQAPPVAPASVTPPAVIASSQVAPTVPKAPRIRYGNPNTEEPQIQFGNTNMDVE